MNSIFDKIIEPTEKFTFLVGAGISMDTPSRVPSAKKFVETLVRLCVPVKEIDSILQKESLRYEVFIEQIQQYIDKSLRFLDFLETKMEPNIIHYFLAHNIINNKNHVITTNFDYLIEYALVKLLSKEEKKKINPIILRKQYLDLNQINDLTNITQFLLFKLHGSKRNLITEQNTFESLVTTISSLGKGREEGETFNIEPYKKPIISKIIKDRALVILGYSGSDDFDITPFLKEIIQYKKIIWIDHIPESEDIEINNFNSVQNSDLSKQEKFLYHIKNTHNIETSLIKANTKTFISEFLWPRILQSVEITKIKSEDDMNYLDFDEWIKTLDEYKNIDIITQYKFAGYLYYSLSDWRNALRVWQKGLEMAKSMNDIKGEAEFLTNVASLPSSELTLDKRLENLEIAKELYNNLNDYEGQSSCLNNIGIIYSNNVDFKNAINYYLESLKLNEIHDDLEGSIVPLLNLGATYGKMGNQDKALDYYQRVISIVNKTGDLQHKAQALMNIGVVYKASGENEEALKFFEDALKIDILLGTLPEQTVRLNYIGLLYQELGDYDKALDFFNRGLYLATEINDYESKVSLLHMIGNLYAFLNNEEEATNNWENALKICEEQDMIHNKINILNSMGSSAYNLGNYDDALELFNRSLEVAQRIGDKNFIIEMYNSIAVVSHSIQDYERAYNSYLMILDLLKDEDNIESKAKYLRSMAISYYSYTQDGEMAIEILKEAQEIYERLGDAQTKEEIKKDIEQIQYQ
ncbi:MAG: putative Tetratricopeptide repeat protein [Promethearchaeota archaeon]|nr:MAG: putative Tetratricopeptide repeat protein [Candidatus Lokiarchaeota archaeon]